MLEITLNPAGLIAESDTNNNTCFVPVSIPPQSCPGVPANDVFAAATVIPNSVFSSVNFNNCASKQSGEPNHAGDVGGHSLWYSWTPASNQTAVITTKGSDFDTLLAVYTGNSVSTLNLVVSNDDIIQNQYRQSLVTFPASAGTVYRIAVDGYGGAVGTAVLNVNPPANDDFSTPSLISGQFGSFSGTTVGSSKEPYEPAHAFDVGGHSVWFRWTAPASGPADFNTAGSSFDTTLAVYLGTIVTNLTLVAGNNDDLGGVYSSRVVFNAVAGTTYQVAIDGFAGDLGSYSLNWNMASRLAINSPVGGSMPVNFSGVNWQRYALLASSNLTSWYTQAVLTMAGSLSYSLVPTNSGACFYRTVRLP